MSNSIIRTIVAAAIGGAAPAAAQQTITLPAKDEALQDRPAAVFTVGTVEGQNWEMFSGIRSIAFDGADNMYLLDGQNNRVVVFDARGGFVRQFGKQGGGPGEFQAPIAMDLAADGNIVVSDLGNRAFIVFTTAGDYVRNVPFDEELGFPVDMMADGRGGVVTRSMQGIRRSPTNAGAAAFSPIQRHSLTGDGSTPQTLYRIPVRPPKVVESGGSGGARRVMSRSMDPVFGPRASFGMLPVGLAIHHETAYAVRILDDGGRHVRTIARDFTPRKVTKKDQERWKEQRAEDLANGAGPTVVMARSAVGAAPSVTIGSGGQNPSRPPAMSLDDTPFAEFMSVVTSIRTDPQGRVWVQRRSSDGGVEGPIDLLTSAGRYIGTLPAQALPDAVSPSGLAAWIVTDDLGVERIEVRRLPASWR